MGITIVEHAAHANWGRGCIGNRRASGGAARNARHLWRGDDAEAGVGMRDRLIRGTRMYT